MSRFQKGRAAAPVSQDPLLAGRLAALPASPTVAMTQKARDLRASGRDVIALSMGEPDFDTPRHVRDAAKAAIDEGQTRYTAVGGTAALKDAIRTKFFRDNGLTFEDAEVMATTGAKFLIYAALMATVEKGDEVVIPAPYWVSYPDMVRLAEGVPRIVSTGAEDGFVPTAEAIEQAITPRTKWLLLNFPNNPSGATATDDQLRAIGAVLQRHPHVWLMTDDIYEHIVFERPFRTLPSLMPALADRTLVVNGASKAYAMTGWRIGIGGGPKPLIAAMTKFAGQSTSNPSSVSQAAAAAAFAGDHSFLDEWRAAFRARRDLVLKGLEDAGLPCVTPGGAFYVFPSCAPLLGRTVEGRPLQDDVAVCEAILEQEGIALVPGSAFGSPGHFRLSYAAGTDILEQAMTCLARFAERSA